MKHLATAFNIMLVTVVSGSSMASAEVCGSRITTIETMLAKMDEATNGVPKTLPDGQLLWLRNFSAARRHLDEARSYLVEGDEFNCNFHVTIAFRRLGAGQ
jgi:uncharacterized protein YfaQ (DUF2300 family)